MSVGSWWKGRQHRQAMAQYRRARSTPYRDSICNAPLTNLYFSVDGQASPCWLYFPTVPPRWSPERSIRDIWQGEEFTKVRKALAEDRFIGRCKECEHDILAGDRPLAAAYDFPHPIGEWPSMLELELSNLCNLECVMCHGRLSSKIRKNREQLPPLVSPYDETFVEQVAELAPHLRELRINGGEPLLQPIVFQLTERIGDVAPDLKVTIATNGTVINSKVRRMMERCNIHINLSLDSLVPERYESIRVHSDFAKVMDHFAEFNEYCHANDRTLCVMVNPMRMNWMEMADYVWWCNERDVHLWFNTIREPVDLALHSLPADELDEIRTTLGAASMPVVPEGRAGDKARNNVAVFERFLGQVDTWRDEARREPDRTTGVPVVLGPRRTADG